MSGFKSGFLIGLIVMALAVYAAVAHYVQRPDVCPNNTMACVH